MKFDFDEIFEAFEFVSFGYPSEHEAYIDTISGEIYLYSEWGDMENEMPEDIGSKRYVEVPHKNELGLGKPLAIKFTYEVLPDQAEKVEEIFRRKGAYSRFKDLLEKNDALQNWYDFESASQIRALREWCEANGIEVHR